MSVARIICATLGLLVAASCGDHIGPVPLLATWPASVKNDNYEAVTAEWTRTAKLHSGYQEAARIDATFKSPTWRLAQVDRNAKLQGLGDADRAEMLQRAHDDDDKFYEVEIVLTTWERRMNDLDRLAKSVWQISLFDDQGHRIAATKIDRDRRPKQVIAADFPASNDFSQAYLVYFPKLIPLLGPSTHQVRLRASSSLGALDVTWDAQ